MYNSLYEVTENVVTAFKPVFIKHPEFPKDVFQRNFSSVEPKKRNFLHKFANLCEHYELLYDIHELKLLALMPVEKLKSLYKLAYLKDSFGIKRLEPNQLFALTKLPDEKLRFLAPFMRQKNAEGMFNYSFESLKAVAGFSEKEAQKAMLLLDFKMPANDLITLCKDKNADTSALKKRLDTLEKLFPDNIYETSVQKSGNKYIVTLIAEKDHSIHKYVFDNSFNLDKRYKSDVDFERQTLKEKSFFKKFNIFSQKRNPVVQSVSNNLRVSEKEHFYALDDIRASVDYLKQIYLVAYKHNFYVMHSGKGNFIDTDYRLPEGMLVEYWQKGAISQDDLIKICSENAGLIPDKDFKYFAVNKIKMTRYDNDKYLEIRRNNALSQPVKIGSDYYNKVLQKTLKLEEEKLKNIKAEKKLIVLDGLPGAGKTTIIKKILKDDFNSYYTPDSDDIKSMFAEVYKNGEYADLVHKASSHILKTEIVPMVLTQGKNFIYQTAGGSVNIHKIIQQAKNKGYTVDFIHIATPKQQSIERSLARFEPVGRFVDPYVSLSIFNHNNREKKYAAKIFSYHENIRNAYRVENGEVFLIKNGRIERKEKL